MQRPLSVRVPSSHHRFRSQPVQSSRHVCICIALVVLLILLFYTYAATFTAPYPGIDLSPNWVVRSLESCVDSPAWCEVNRNQLKVGDQLLVIGGLTREQAQQDRGQVPFAGYRTGDWVTIAVASEGKVEVIQWQMLGPTLRSSLARLFQSLFLYLPFWLFGTFILLSLQPKNRQWLLLIVFHYLTSVWLAVGTYSYLQIAYTSPTQRALAWLLAPVYLHLHMIAPSSLFPQLRRLLLPLLYGVAGYLAVLELVQKMPDGVYNFGLLVAVLGSLVLLLLRLLPRNSKSDQTSVYLMLTGICMAMGPGIVLAVVPTLFDIPTRDQAFLMALASFAIPLLPAFYIYAIYKPYLNKLEPWVHNVLMLYSFTLLCLSSLILAHTVIETFYDVDLPTLWLVTVVLVIATPVLRDRYQQVIERIAYGSLLIPEEIIYIFANKMPTAPDTRELVSHLVEEILPRLGICQSAMYSFRGNSYELIYRQQVTPGEEPETADALKILLGEAERYRPDSEVTGSPHAWVRLVIPLQIREETIGIWLFGLRDPDNYYPLRQVTLLKTLGKQVAVAIENILLFRELQHYANSLQTSINKQQAMQAQLIQAGKLASLGTLAAGIAHELNNPLAGIKLFTGNLRAFDKRGQLTSMLLGDTLADIDQLVDKSDHIIRHFQDFSRRSDGEFRVIDINVPLQNALRLLEQQLRLRDIRIHAKLGSNLSPVAGDMNQLEQVAINLITNARDAMSHSSCCERVLTLRTYQMTDIVIMEVADTGCGIAATHLERIFDPFYTTKAVGEGTGLGLSISYGIIRNHGGKIEVDSVHHQGTIFYVRLPVAPP